MKRLFRQMIVGLQLLGCSAGSVVGSDGTDARSVVQQLTDTIYATLRPECGEIMEQPERLYTLVDQVLLPHADLNRMSQWVLGKHWRSADPEQRQAFAQQFRQLLVRTYATAIQTVSPENIHYLPGRDTGKADQATVRTQIRQPGQPITGIDYAMHRQDGRWLVYDVRVEGVSLVTNYRTAFGEQIREKGLPAFIDALQHQNREAMPREIIQQIRSLQSRSCKQPAQ